MSLGHGANIVRDGLVLHLDAANAKSGFIQNLENINSTFEAYNSPVISSSILYDGINDYSMSENSEFLKWHNWDKLSVQLFYKHISATGANGIRQYIFDFRTNGGIDGALGLFTDGLNLKLFYNVGNTTYEEPTVYTHNYGQWYHYCFTFDKTISTNNVRHYINGEIVLNRSIDITNNETASGSRIWIGRYGGGNYLFNGEINNFMAWQNKILTQSEIKQNFEATRGRYGV